MLRKDGGVIIVKKKVAGVSEGALRRFAARAMEAARVAGEVNVLVTDNRELQRLNRRFRNKNEATDVLSFPAETTGSTKLAGEIAISAEKAALNASRLGHSAVEEIKILILHGILHLAGYDHDRDNGVMGRKEAQLRRAFELPVALIERHDLASQIGRNGLKKSRGT
jgi:probable rRNA maturation factor